MGRGNPKGMNHRAGKTKTGEVRDKSRSVRMPSERWERLKASLGENESIEDRVNRLVQADLDRLTTSEG